MLYLKTTALSLSAAILICHADTVEAQLVSGPYVIAPLDVNGGGGMSSNGGYSITSSTVQHGGVEGMNGGTYSIRAGYWPVALAADCNGNGVDDAQDISGATSVDCNLNAVPDECESVIFVDDSATNGLNNGSSWGNAFTTLQDALTDAASRCEVAQLWVAEGTYRPDQGGGQTPLDRTATFQLQNGLGIYGGFAGGETDLSQRDISNNVTILSGDIDSDDILSNGISKTINGNNSYHVVFSRFKDPTAMLDGFSISGGNANDPVLLEAGNGGGLFNSDSSPTIANCAFVGNAAINGGGVENETFATPSFNNCVFSGNSASNSGNPTAANGGGMWNSNATPTLTDCIFTGNSSGGTAGGLGADAGTDAIVTRCIFTGNTANGNGGGMWINVSSPTITDCTFSANSATNGGGGIYNLESTPIVTNSAFTGNSADLGGGIANDNSGGIPAARA